MRFAYIVIALVVTLAFTRGGPVIANIGYCPDITSTTCPAKDFWPRGLRTTSVGTEAYYFVSNERPARVCFVTRDVYATYGIGQLAPSVGCIWRDYRP